MFRAILALFSVMFFSTVEAQMPEQQEILDVLTKVNRYFMKKWPDPGQATFVKKSRPSNLWTRAVYYEGLMALNSIDPQYDYFDYAYRWGEAHSWTPRDGVTTTDADNYCCSQTYIDMYRIAHEEKMLSKAKENFDLIIANKDNSAWFWIDAIQMGMPGLAKMGAVTGDHLYWDKMWQMYIHTRNIEGGKGMYNAKDGLWWRDKDFDPPYKEPNGRNCYWARGNGWVYAALARVLNEIPSTEAHYKDYLRDFVAMSRAIKSCVRKDGYWNVSMHDESNFGGREVSGTSLFVYGMAWGVRNGILKEKEYLPLIEKAWNAMSKECVHPDTGMLGFVQGTGKEPKDGQPVGYDNVPDFEDYGIGCFLLAGSEVFRLANKKMEYSFDGTEGDNGAFFFSAEVPDGNYKITVTYGSKKRAANTCLRAESRRLIMENADTRKGELRQFTCIVNKRNLTISGSEKVRINSREVGKLNWDDKLTIEVNGDAPAISHITIERVYDVPTVFLCGNSTVVDQDYEPWASWGQMIPRFFDEGLCFANHGESGESANTFIAEGRLKKILTQLKAGDYVFVEFGHNDQKQKGPGKGAYYSFATSLKEFVDEVRSRHAQIVFCTPTQRRNFGPDGKIIETHENYPEAMQWVANKENVPLIDLHQMTRVLFETMGIEGSKRALVHYPAGTYPGQTTDLADNTHFNPYGAYQVAKCVIEGMKELKLPLVEHLRKEYTNYTPSNPDEFEEFYWNNSPRVELETPLGDNPQTLKDNQPKMGLADVNNVVDLTLDSLNLANTARPVSGSTRKGKNPVLFLIGDSTMRTGTKGNGDNGQWGWGYFAHDYFDEERISVENHALGGMSSRTFYNHLWPDVLKGIEAGDYVIIQLGHNDNGPYDEGRARASIPGIGKDSLVVTIKETGVVETIYTYGEYMRRYINDIKSKGAHPILFSLTPRNSWDDAATVTRKWDTFTPWGKQVAAEEGIPYVDLEAISASKFEQFGPEKVNYMFYLDKIHGSEFGAQNNARSAAEGIAACEASDLRQYLLPLNLPMVEVAREPGKPMLFLCGDSTMKNADSDENGMWGWGAVADYVFDTNKITIANCGMAGRSTRTFLDEGRWDKVYNSIQPGDYVVIQFGHNDMGDINTGKARAVIRGTADSSHVYLMEPTRKYKVVYTFGWYLRKFIGDVREKGGIPILVSITPRNEWPEGKIERRNDSYGLWFKEVVEQTNVDYVDMHNITADFLDNIGKEKSASYYNNDHTHTSKLGAQNNAVSFAKGLKSIAHPLAEYLK